MVITERRLLVPRERVDSRFVYKAPKDQALVMVGATNTASDNATKAVVDSHGRYFGRGMAGRQRQIEHLQNVMENGAPVERIRFSGGPVGAGVGDDLFYRFASRDNRTAHADPEARQRARAEMRADVLASGARGPGRDGGAASSARDCTLRLQHRSTSTARTDRSSDRANPLESAREIPTARPLPEGWRKLQSRSRPGAGYYYDRARCTSQWERPQTAPIGVCARSRETRR